jgi:hypothetical protein
MSERKSGQQPLPIRLQLELPPGTAITLVAEKSAETGLPRQVDRITPVDVKRHYPRETFASPALIRRFVQTYKDAGSDHPETERLMAQIDQHMDQVKRRGCSFERYTEDLDRVLGELRSQIEGHKMGEESQTVIEIRAMLTELALNKFEQTS